MQARFICGPEFSGTTGRSGGAGSRGDGRGFGQSATADGDFAGAGGVGGGQSEATSIFVVDALSFHIDLGL